jgi:hypothetical protein
MLAAKPLFKHARDFAETRNVADTKTRAGRASMLRHMRASPTLASIAMFDTSAVETICSRNHGSGTKNRFEIIGCIELTAF